MILNNQVPDLYKNRSGLIQKKNLGFWENTWMRAYVGFNPIKKYFKEGIIKL